MSKPDTTHHKLNPQLLPKLRPRKESTLADAELATWGAAFGRAFSGVLVVPAVALFAVLTAFALWASHLSKRETPNVSPLSRDGADEVAKIEAARQLIRDFAACRTVEQRISLVSNPAVIADRMHDYYARTESLHGPIQFFPDYSLDRVNGSPLILLNYQSEYGTQRSAIIVDGPAGGRLDWESFVCYEAIPLASLLESSSRELQMLEGIYRIALRPDTYYNFHFSDPTRFVSYQIRNIHGATGWAYTGRNSPVDQYVTRLLARQNRQANAASKSPVAKLTVRLVAIPDEIGETRKQLVLDAILGETWYYPSS